MANYAYRVLTAEGKEKKGSMEADDPDKVRITLKADGLLPLEIKEQGVLSKDIDFSIGRKVKPRDMSIFCRQFVSIVNAGVSIVDAMEMLGDQTENKTLKAAIESTRVGIQKGGTLADSMRLESNVFPSMLINMVEAGESSGNLDIAFDRMGTQFEKEAKLKSMTQKAMIYPIIVSMVSVGVVIVMLTFVIPKFMSMFEGMDIEMPAITMAVVNLSNFAIKYWYLILGAVFLFALALRAFRKSDLGKSMLDRIVLKIPLAGKLVTKTACARFTRTLSTLLTAGIPLMNALEITARTMSNVLFRNALMDAREEVSKGIELAEPLQRCGVFPPMVYHMVGIGEKTGDIEEMLDKMADYYDEEVEAATAALMAAMEPLIIVVLALIVGTLILAVMSPITAMYQGLDSI